MLDVIGSLVLGAISIAVLVVLIGQAEIRPAARFVAFAIATVCVSLLVTIAAVGGFGPGVAGPFPTPVLPFLILVILGSAAWLAWPAFRRAVLSIPLVALVGINSVRVAGVFFLMLHAEGRLAAPFSTSAGWGDIVAGAIAIPLTVRLAWKGAVPRWLLIGWNALGALDLFTAVALGALSAAGTPFRVFTEAPGTVAMGTLPWVLIPSFLVPLFLLTHLAVAVRLRAPYTEEVRTHAGSNNVLREVAVRRIA
jgi:hypothetical protein